MKARFLTPLFGMLAGVAFLSGCSTSFSPPPGQLQADKTPIGAITGAVHGGQAPVGSAQIYLFTPGTTGYASSATSLISPTAHGVSCTNPAVTGACYVTTDATYGTFALSGDYVCTPGTVVYMVAVGGNPGISPTTNNTAIVQMAGLGVCPSSGTMAQKVPYLVINEVTTVAFAYAMGGFGTDAFHIGSSGTTQAVAALANAVANANNIVALQYGQALTAPSNNSNGVVPRTKINTMADILASCVNTSAPTSTYCKNLFGAATNSSGTSPTNVAAAMFNIVHIPANTTTYPNRVSGIWNLYTGTPVFTPVLAATPSDWALPVLYSGLTSARPSNIAIDSSGNAWVSDRNHNYLVQLGPQGQYKKISPSGAGILYNVGVNLDGTVWAADYTNSKLYQMDSNGNVLQTVSTGVSGPVALAFDKSGEIYALNASSNSIARFTSAGSSVGAATYPTALGTPYSLAIDTNYNTWIPGNGGGCQCVAQLQNGALSAGSIPGYYFFLFFPIATSQIADSLAIAVDGNNNPWQANVASELIEFYTGSVNYGLGNQTVVQDTHELTTGGINNPVSLAMDGTTGGGSVWVANSAASTVSGYANGGTLLANNGFSTGSAGGTYAVATDPSGNLWTANSDGTVTQFLGLTTPTVTPLIPGAQGSRP